MKFVHKFKSISMVAWVLALSASACADRLDRVSPAGSASADYASGQTQNDVSAEQSVQEDPFVPEVACQTRYPILLVHGVGGRDSDFGVNYFNRIPDYLSETCKIEVFQGGQDAFSSSDVNGEQLQEAILKITDELGFKKVNIVAHSKGALDIRKMFFQTKGQTINGRSMNDRVASFTSLSAPHRGSALADYLLSKVGDNTEDLIATFLDIYGKSQGDSDDIDSSAALKELSSEGMAAFNEKLGDLETGIPGVYCQSWTSDIGALNQNLALLATSKIMNSLGFEVNDGAVQESSTIYGKYRGVVGQDINGGVSHSAMVDRPGGFDIDTGFDARVFYSDMLTELSTLGY